MCQEGIDKKKVDQTKEETKKEAKLTREVARKHQEADRIRE